MRSTYKIELKIDIPQDDESTKEILRTAMRNAAQLILAQAIMVSDKRQPMIAVTSDNNFDGPETIKIDEA